MGGGLKVLIIFAIMRLGVYPFLLMGWGSNRKYALLGAHRAVAQVVSYEVCLFLFVLSSIYIEKTYEFYRLTIIQRGIWVALCSAPLFLMWVLLCLAEANRTPFDLAEGESEIVSGFNIEYGGGLFALIFIREYGIILSLGFLTSIFFLGVEIILMKTFLVRLLFVWTRCAFPRVRYDKLMIIS